MIHCNTKNRWKFLFVVHIVHEINRETSLVINRLEVFSIRTKNNSPVIIIIWLFTFWYIIIYTLNIFISNSPMFLICMTIINWLQIRSGGLPRVIKWITPCDLEDYAVWSGGLPSVIWWITPCDLVYTSNFILFQ